MHQITVWGTLENDTILGFQPDLYGIHGGPGHDTVKYDFSSVYLSVSYHVPTETYDKYHDLVIEHSGDHRAERVMGVSRLEFTDKGFAVDLDSYGYSGIAAKAIIATFGAESLGAYMSAALAIVDGGTTLESLCDLVVENSYIENLVGSTTNGSFVDHVYENVVGTAPSSADHDTYTALLDNGTYTKSSLLALAANTTLTENLVTANSVDLIGVPGSADGELLALQYDIGLG